MNIVVYLDLSGGFMAGGTCCQEPHVPPLGLCAALQRRQRHAHGAGAGDAGDAGRRGAQWLAGAEVAGAQPPRRGAEAPGAMEIDWISLNNP